MLCYSWYFQVFPNYVSSIHILFLFDLCVTLPAILTLRVHFLSHLESVWVGQVSVGRGDGEDQAAFLSDELHNHVSNLVLDVYRLVAHSNLSHTGQIDESQIQYCWTEKETSDIYTMAAECGLRKAVVLGSLVLYYRVARKPSGWWE